MVVFYISTIVLVCISISDPLLDYEFSISQLTSRVYEPFVIAVIVLSVIIPVILVCYYLFDIGRNDSIEDDEKTIWRSFLIKATILGPMFYYDYKYQNSLSRTPRKGIFRNSRNKSIEYFDITIPSYVKHELDVQNIRNSRDLSLVFFLVGIITIILSIVVGIFE